MKLHESRTAFQSGLSLPGSGVLPDGGPAVASATWPARSAGRPATRRGPGTGGRRRLWQDTYGITNQADYFGEGMQTYFDCARGGNLRRYDGKYNTTGKTLSYGMRPRRPTTRREHP